MTHVRPARESDLPAIVELMHELARFERMEGPPADAAERLRRDAFSGGKVELWVAEREGRVVAYAATCLAYSTFRARPVLYLEDLFVTADARRGGVARAVLARLAREALARGCARMSWVVLDWNVDAQRAYERFGATRQAQWWPYTLEKEGMEKLVEADPTGPA